MELSWTEVREATSEFLENIGSGGSSDVFKGTLNQQRVAIKVIREPDQAMKAEQFKQEVALLSRVSHENLVSLIGFCDDLPNRCIVYDLVEGSTLAESGKLLTWDIRISVAFDVASALCELHGHDPPIVHRDVNPNNVILSTTTQRAKLGDLGVSKAFDRVCTHVTTRVFGTPGYIDPEFVNTGQLRPAVDIYSFGVMLLESLTGLNVISEEGHLIDALEDISDSELSQLSGKRLERFLRKIESPVRGVDLTAVSSLWGLAVNCVHRRHKNRPRILEVLEQIGKVKEHAARSVRLALLKAESAESADRWRARRLDMLKADDLTRSVNGYDVNELEQRERDPREREHRDIVRRLCYSSSSRTRHYSPDYCHRQVWSDRDPYYERGPFDAGRCLDFNQHGLYNGYHDYVDYAEAWGIDLPS